MGSPLPSLKHFARRFINFFSSSSLFPKKTQCPSMSSTPAHPMSAPRALPGSIWFQVLVRFSPIPVRGYILPPSRTIPAWFALQEASLTSSSELSVNSSTSTTHTSTVSKHQFTLSGFLVDENDIANSPAQSGAQEPLNIDLVKNGPLGFSTMVFRKYLSIHVSFPMYLFIVGHGTGVC